MAKLTTPENIILNRKAHWESCGHHIKKDEEWIKELAQYMFVNDKLFNEVRANPEYAIEMFFTIVDKNRKTVPFFLNETQKDFIRTLNQAKKDYKDGYINAIRIIVLKRKTNGNDITYYRIPISQYDIQPQFQWYDNSGHDRELADNI